MGPNGDDQPLREFAQSPNGKHPHHYLAIYSASLPFYHLRFGASHVLILYVDVSPETFMEYEGVAPATGFNLTRRGAREPGAGPAVETANKSELLLR